MLIFLLIILLLSLYLYKPRIISVFYDIPQYKDLLQNSFNLTIGGIPKLIIKTSWQTINKMPLEMANALELTKKLNPDYKLYYFDDTDVLQFMKDYSEDAFIAYNKLIPGAFKADLFRYCILEKYGGCYSDIGHVMKVSFDEIIGDAGLVIVKDKPVFYHGIHNALLCSQKNTVFMKELIKKCISNINNNYYGTGTLDITGPTMMGNVYNCIFEKDCFDDNKEIIEVGTTNKIKILKIVFQFFQNTISDIDDNELIVTKFDNYPNIMYINVPRYTVLWKLRQVYK
jgi:mannosyltransferase OCH1-like enzyme